MLGRKDAPKPADAAPMRPSRLIVGLGNPGREYEQTPHNLGFLALDAVAARGGIRITRPEAKSLVGRGELAGQAVVLAKPQTMMNLSGVAVRMLLEKYDADPAEMIALVDDVDLPWAWGRTRLGASCEITCCARWAARNERLRTRCRLKRPKQWN